MLKNISDYSTLDMARVLYIINPSSIPRTFYCGPKLHQAGSLKSRTIKPLNITSVNLKTRQKKLYTPSTAKHSPKFPQ